MVYFVKKYKTKQKTINIKTKPKKKSQTKYSKVNRIDVRWIVMVLLLPKNRVELKKRKPLKFCDEE